MPVAATVYLSETNTVGAVTTDDVANMNFGGVDLVNIVPADHPVVRPGLVASFRSFLKEWRVKVHDIGDSLLITDFRMWKTSGAYVAGEEIDWNTNGGGGNAYVTPDNTTAFSGSAVPTADPGSANISGSISASGNYAPSNTTFLRFFMLGNVSGITTPIGAVNQKTFIWQYDES